jgi:ATP-binding protein involved in chromosome partitioning
VDADIYGPSIPLMFNVENEKLTVLNVENETKLQPIEKYGIKLLSIGFLVDPESAVIWRGPMASKALNQLFEETEWGEIDYMIVDLPPGTGDIPLTIVQQLDVTGAIIVTTPQSIALSDVRKACNMFLNESINVPIMGIVENMSFFMTNETPSKKCHLFGKGGGKALAEQFHVPLLGQIPISESICSSGEAGVPIAHEGVGLISIELDKIAASVIHQTHAFEEHYY